MLVSNDNSLFVSCILGQSKKKACRKACTGSYCSQRLDRFGWNMIAIMLVNQNSTQTAQSDDNSSCVTPLKYLPAPNTRLVYTSASSDLQGINGWDVCE